MISEKFKIRLKETAHQAKREGAGYLFIAPFMILFILFTVLPVLISVVLSFTYYNVLEAPSFIGWENYTRLILNDDVFLQAVKNTFVYACITGPVGYFASFILAWLLCEMGPTIRSILVFIFYIPSMSSSMYVIWSYLFSSDSYGFINSMLLKVGIINSPILWLQNSKYILAIIILASLWMSLGTSFLTFVAGIQSFDKTLLEAGAVDGIRNRFQELWYITLPTMRPQLMFTAVITIAQAFSVSDIAMNLAGLPSVEYAGHTIVTHLLDYGNIRFEMGYACSIASVLFVIMITANKLITMFIRRIGK
ncbi:MAG: sugar ABC transporter permease [Clostridia bacterium]|nr:sugar ABC transporter permease [Clostridia bacterium]